MNENSSNPNLDESDLLEFALRTETLYQVLPDSEAAIDAFVNGK